MIGSTGETTKRRSRNMVGENKSNRLHLGRISQRIHEQVQRTSSQSETAHRTDGMEKILWAINGGLCVTKYSTIPKVEYQPGREKCSGDHHRTNEIRISEHNKGE
ncbi:unnamed protein product [Macrosiphum euphorbiae]|uniref:Uncharacterized protein n=1 Tax=Macrosiphum euphorbiae TaxID=13131 RepID=A0AAV0XV73_9HEMI|nr:unnamed protein product [Macrosiphum euphorbiae]